MRIRIKVSVFFQKVHKENLIWQCEWQWQWIDVVNDDREVLNVDLVGMEVVNISFIDSLPSSIASEYWNRLKLVREWINSLIF